MVIFANIRKFRNKSHPKFIKLPQFDPKSPYVTNIHTLVYGKCITEDDIARLALGENIPMLYRYCASKMNDAVYQLYQIPIIRKYFGEDLTHGIHCICNDSGVVFVNIDDTPESDAYIRELVHYMELHLETLLDQKGWYLFFGGDHFRVMDRKEFKKQKCVCEGHIAWNE